MSNESDVMLARILTAAIAAVQGGFNATTVIDLAATWKRSGKTDAEVAEMLENLRKSTGADVRKRVEAS